MAEEPSAEVPPAEQPPADAPTTETPEGETPNADTPTGESPPIVPAEDVPDPGIDTTKLSVPLKVGLAVTSGVVATMLVHPLDVWKFNRQVATTPESNMVAKLMKKKGIRGLFPGLSANMLSQLVFVTVRLGCYGAIMNEIDSIYSNENKFDDTARHILTASVIGAFFTTPAEMALVRCAIDAQQPARFRKYYSGGINAMSRILTSEGYSASFRGGIPTMGRTGLAWLCNSFIYWNIKKQLHDNQILKNENEIRFLSLALSSLCTAVVTLPVDVMKTRYQAMRTDAMGRPEYCGYNELFCKIRYMEGSYAPFCRGFIPYTLRIMMHTFLGLGIFQGLIYATSSSTNEEGATNDASANAAADAADGDGTNSENAEPKEEGGATAEEGAVAKEEVPEKVSYRERVKRKFVLF